MDNELNLLSIVDLYNDPFIDLNKNIKDNDFKNHINDFIIIRTPDEDSILEFTGHITNVDNNKLYIDEVDFNINDLIEYEYINKKEFNYSNELYKDKRVKLTNIYNKSIEVYIINIDESSSLDSEIEFYFKHIVDNNYVVDYFSYPKYLINNIELINN